VYTFSFFHVSTNSTYDRFILGFVQTSLKMAHRKDVKAVSSTKIPRYFFLSHTTVTFSLIMMTVMVMKHVMTMPW
jgi:hypothetical protein